MNSPSARLLTLLSLLCLSHPEITPGGERSPQPSPRQDAQREEASAPVQSQIIQVGEHSREPGLQPVIPKEEGAPTASRQSSSALSFTIVSPPPAVTSAPGTPPPLADTEAAAVSSPAHATTPPPPLTFSPTARPPADALQVLAVLATTARAATPPLVAHSSDRPPCTSRPQSTSTSPTAAQPPADALPTLMAGAGMGTSSPMAIPVPTAGLPGVRFLGCAAPMTGTAEQTFRKKLIDNSQTGGPKWLTVGIPKEGADRGRLCVTFLAGGACYKCTTQDTGESVIRGLVGCEGPEPVCAPAQVDASGMGLQPCSDAELSIRGHKCRKANLEERSTFLGVTPGGSLHVLFVGPRQQIFECLKPEGDALFNRLLTGAELEPAFPQRRNSLPERALATLANVFAPRDGERRSSNP